MTKYNNKRINTEDGWFDSKAEYERWKELKLLVRSGHIKNLRRSVRYELIPKLGRLRAIHYVADFVYEENGKEVVEDKKGYRNRLYMLKARLMQWRHNIEILES